MGAWLDRVPLVWLLAIASWLALAPFFPEPHLWEKLKMLAAGTLTRPIDIFDLLMHAVPLALLAWRLVRQARQAKG
ncbi:MAG: RND transporter [Betaproteobacteria bacterium]|nr:RND transporter [Betaproteobacteria bacterium]MBK8108137.1 RND transporter [Betaproteobacteria bacterium]